VRAGKITKEDNVVIKTLRLEKSWSSWHPMKELPLKEWSRISLDSFIQTMMLVVRLPVILVAGIPNRLTTSPFVQDFICSQNDEVLHPGLFGAPIVVHFNYVKFAAEYLL